MSIYVLVGPCADDKGFWVRVEIKNSDSGHGIVEMSTSDARRFIQQMELVLQMVDANINVRLKENAKSTPPDQPAEPYLGYTKDIVNAYQTSKVI